MKGGQRWWEGHEEDVHTESPSCDFTHYVLSGADLLGQLAALHCTQVQVLVEELSIEDVSHSVLQASPIKVHHSGHETDVESEAVRSNPDAPFHLNETPRDRKR